MDRNRDLQGNAHVRAGELRTKLGDGNAEWAFAPRHSARAPYSAKFEQRARGLANGMAAAQVRRWRMPTWHPFEKEPASHGSSGGGCPIRATPISPTEKQVCHSADNESASHEPIGGGMTDPRDACRRYCERRANVSVRAVEGLPGHSEERPFKVERAVSFLNSDMPSRHVGASRTFLPMGERGCLCPFGRCGPSRSLRSPAAARLALGSPPQPLHGKMGQGEGLTAGG